MHDCGKRVDRLTVQQDVDLDQVCRQFARRLVVEACTPVRDFRASKKSKTISASGSV